jgi:tRNA A-37 threonylcarbamoyl transferase component Bud32
MPKKQLDSFDFPEGFIFSKKFCIQRRLGSGWEGEVYAVQELQTGIERAAKFFYPHRNKNNSAAKFAAKKFHKLRDCSMVTHYMTQERIFYRGFPIHYLISEYVEGEILSNFLTRQPGKRLHWYRALHLLYGLAKGMEEVHREREYHGDLHSDNVIVQSAGLEFDLKLIDFYQWGPVSRENIAHDVAQLIRILYEAIGGKKYYAKQPNIIKEICCGLKNSLIQKKFRSAGKLREFLELTEWD